MAGGRQDGGSDHPLMTPAEVAHALRIDARTVTRWASAGRLTFIRTPGGHRRYRRSEVMAIAGAAHADAAELGRLRGIIAACLAYLGTAEACEMRDTITEMLREAAGERPDTGGAA